ncbi:MAG: DUF4363 family protein [Clostridia bacterium]|nr:DUF4363 family protein [Clostridia bacterium]
MYKRTTAIVMLAIMGAGFYLWSMSKKQTISGFNTLLERLYMETESQSWQDAENTVSELKAYHKSKRDSFNMLEEHELMDTAEQHINQLEELIKIKDEKNAKRISLLLNTIFENHLNGGKINLANIL